MVYQAIFTKAANLRCLIVLLSGILIAWFSIPVMAEFNALGVWRSKLVLTGLKAENNFTVAYKEARSLKAMLPNNATPVDQVRLLNLLSRIEIYQAMTNTAAARVQQTLDLVKKHGDSVWRLAAIADSAVILNQLINSRLRRTKCQLRRLVKMSLRW